MSNIKISRRPAALLRAAAASLLSIGFLVPVQAAPIDLADAPLFSTSTVPANLILALSVEWPTASTPAYLSTTAYDPAPAKGYVGYFDPEKCYRYIYDATTPSNSYFMPYGAAASHACSSSSTVPLWSGNYLNWATTQTLDSFRWALTGGHRVVDTTTSTIVEKTRHSGQGSIATTYPNKSLASGVSGATPFNWGTARTRMWKGGTAMWITANTNTVLSVDPLVSVDYNAQNSYTAVPASTTLVYKMYVRVKVCDSAVGIEANCKPYGSNYKPEGLMQQYATKLRYSTFGYLNDVETRDGAVMRARMKYVGPLKPIPGSPSVTNANAEWDATTGIMSINPDSADASATTADAAAAGYSVTISDSGVMNYLNKFGKVITGNYKSKDPASELYYSAQRYFRNLGNVSQYSDLAGAASAAALSTQLDGFPAIKTWDDPILYSCQKNFILGIGDVNTHSDTNLNGSTLNSIPAVEPVMPAGVSSDTSVDVKVATDMVGTLEGISNLGDTRTGSSPAPGTFKASYYIAGLAYDAHTKDIRPDLTNNVPDAAGNRVLPQTINTYWLDVMENQTYKSKNQYWLAAKYGGFQPPAGFSTYAGTNGTSTLADSTWWASGEYTPLPGSPPAGTADKRPDNYFLADQADKMVAGLTKAFAKIVSEGSTATSTAFSTLTAKVSTSGSASYAAGYDPKTWSGTVIGSTISFDTSGNPTITPQWNARTLLNATLPGARKIVTCCTTAGLAMPFQVANLSATTFSRTYYTSFGSVPGATTQSSSNFVAYLRGDRSNEAPAGNGYRTRSFVLGDIAGSKANPVGGPSKPYFDLSNPGYSTFKRTYASRTPVVYAGANDGMMHAFDGTMPTGGTELFAYIPSFTYGNASSASTSGLASTGNPSFLHHYFVDATPQDYDIDFKKTVGSTASSPDWRTVIIGGLGKGGKGYYAIDVTNPGDWTSETAVAGKVLWEFTDSRMGYTYSDPVVVKTTKYGWVAILASGYNNSDGKGYFFIVNPRTGALLEAVGTADGSLASPLNLAHVTAYVPNYQDFTADAVYAGDLLGNVWRVDLTGSSGSYAAPTKIATLTDSFGVGQPVTTRPLIEVDPISKKRFVLIGTGRLLADSDINNTQLQSLYALADGTGNAGAFYTAATLPSPATYPVSRSNLAANTSLLAGVGFANPIGWYFDLGADAATQVAERINITPVANSGVLGVGVNLPIGAACDETGKSRILAVSFGDGKSVLVDAADAFIASTALAAGLVTELGYKSVGGKPLLLGGDSLGGFKNIRVNPPSSFTLRRLNWRELPTVD